MGDKLDATISITADTSGVEAGVDKTKKSLKTLGSAAQQTAGQISQSGKSAGAGFEGIAGKAQKSLSAIIQAARQMATQVNGSGKTASDGFELIGPSANRSAKEVERATRSMQQQLQRQIAELNAGGKATREYTEALARMRGVDVNALRPLLNHLDSARKKTDEATNSVGSLIGRLGGLKLAAAGVGGALSVSAFVGKLVSVQREFDVLNASLVTVAGSSQAAAQEFDWIKDFAKTTPFGLAQATEAFVKMKSLGLEPTRSSLTSFGNTASAMGKSLNQMIEAVADASTSEFERLKEFGIKASKSGETVSMTFQGVTKNIGNNAAEIVSYLEAIGNNEFAGAMSERANTLDGAIAELGDTWDQVFRTINEQNTGSFIHDSIKLATGAVEDLDTILKALNKTAGDGAKETGALKSVQEGLATVFETVSVAGVTVADTLRGVGTEIGVIAAQAAALAKLDFKGFSAIGEMAKEDAAAARKAWEESVDAILNARKRAAELGASPVSVGGNKSTAIDLNSIATAALNATSAFKSKAEQMAEVQEQGDKLRAALKQLEDGEKGASKEAKQLRERLRGVDERLASMAKSGTAGAAGLKNVESAYATLSKRVNEYISQLALEAKQGDKVTAAQKLQIQLDELLINSKGKLTAANVADLTARIEIASAMEREAKAVKRNVEAYQEYIKDQEAIARAYVELSKAKEALWKNIAEQNIELENQSRMLELEASNIGKSAYERTLANEVLKAQIELEKELRDISNNTEYDAAAKNEAEAAARARAVKKIALAERKAYVTEWEKTSQTIGDTLADYIMGGGKDAAQYLKRLFSTLVLQPVVQTTVGSIFGGSGGAQSVLGGGNGGILGTASNLNSLYSAFSGGITSSIGGAIGSLGSMFGSSALTSFAAGMKGSTLAAGLAGPTTAGASGAMGLGASVGAALPWVAGAAALVGLISKFDDSGTPHMGGSAMWSAATGGKTNLDLLNTSKTDNPLSNIDNQFASGFGWVQDREEVRTALSGLAQGIGSSLDSFAKSFGSAFGYEVALGFADDTSKDGAWGALRIALGGQDIVNWNDNRQSKWAPRSFSDGEEGYKQYLSAVFLDYKTALLGMGLPAWADQILDASSDIDTINAALQQIGATRLIFDQLGQSMQMFSGISGDLQTQLLAASGGIESLSANAGTFYQGFFDESERMEALNQQLRDALSGLDLSIDPAMGDEAKEQFRATVEAAMAGGQGELAAQLLAMSGTFATAADYAQKSAEDAAQAAADAAAAMAQTMQDLLSERRTLSAEYLRASGDAEGYAEALRAIATEGYTDAERAAWDYNEALRSQIAAFDEAAQLQQSLAEITGQTAQSVQGVLQDLLGRVQATSAFRASLGSSIESARLGTLDLSGQADYLRTKESGLWSQLGSAADPVAVAEQLQQTILDRISVESQLREQLDSQTLGALQQQLSVAQSLQSAAQSMQSTVDGLRLGNTSALSPYAQLQYAGSKFDDAYARALAGDLDAWKDVQSFGQSYVGLGRDVFASSTDSADIFFKVTEAMDQLVALGLDADPQITALNTQIDLLQTVGQNTEQQTWVSEQQLQAFEQLDSVLQRQQLQQQQQADKQLALAQQQIDELRKHNELLQAQITQQAQISAEQKQRDAKLISAAEKSADAARMAEAQA